MLDETWIVTRLALRGRARTGQRRAGREPGAPLLRSKLQPPATRPALLPRPRLDARLSAIFDHPITLLAAPAGYGKTTLLAAWAGGRPSGWLALDAADNDPLHFYNYLIAACESIVPGCGRASRAALRSDTLADAESILAPLLAALETAPDPALLVLDDYQAIESYEVHAALQLLIDHLPPALHLVLLGRGQPLLPLARLRARGHLLEIPAAELLFTPAESADLLRSTLRLDLPDDTLDDLHRRTEGWPTGLHLAVLDSSDGFTLDYLAAEVLATQPPEVVHFLFHTAPLESFNAELAQAIMAGTAQPNVPLIPGANRQPAATLEYILHNDLFLLPLADRPGWYRYHSQFAATLRRHIQAADPALAPLMQRRAAEWFAEQGLDGEAISYALDAGATDHAAALIGRAGVAALRRGDLATLRGWLSAIDPALVAATPRLNLLQGWADLLAADFAAATNALARATETDEDKALIDGLRLALGRTDGATLLIDAADVGALERARSSGDWLALCEVVLAQAQQQIAAGQIEAASAMLDACQGQIAAEHGPAAPLAAVIGAASAMLHYQRNDLDAADALLDRALPGIEQQGLHIFRPFVEAERARVAAARGDLVAARAALQGVARGMQRMADRSMWADFLALRQVETWLILGDTAAAARWAMRGQIPQRDSGDFADLLHQQMLAQVLIGCWPCTEMVAALLTQARLGPLALAQRLLARCAEAFSRQGYDGLLLDVYTLQAVAHELQGANTAALGALANALALAAAEDHRRPFLNRGRTMAELLAQFVDQRPPADPLRAFALRLLPDFPADERAQASRDDESADSFAAALPPVESLSSRELDVLRLLAKGQTSREIAATLTIAFDTARTHTKNIYGKLGARNRVEAIARARALRMI